MKKHIIAAFNAKFKKPQTQEETPQLEKSEKKSKTKAKSKTKVIKETDELVEVIDKKIMLENGKELLNG